MSRNNEGFKSLLPLVDCVIRINQEKIPDCGEDSYCYSINKQGAMVAVFDGCGGAGATPYREYGNRTGAYIAARACAFTTEKWFDYALENGVFAAQNADPALTLKDCLFETVHSYEKGTEKDAESRILGTMTKKFPTTVAAAALSQQDSGPAADYLWAGDSRGYWLDSEGLCQVTEDDLNIKDAFENLTADGRLLNIVSASKDFEIHWRRIPVKKPGLIIAATDGCFGYLSTPMEFEYLLLDTLSGSDSIFDWEKRLAERILAYAGDDFTLCALAVAFGDFSTLKKSFAAREKYLLDNYISKLENSEWEQKKELWMLYKEQYSRLAK